MKENKYLKQAKEELAYLSDDPDFQLFVESRAGMLRDIECMKRCGYNDGRENGLKEGLAEVKKKQLEIAKKMKDKNMTLNDIIELTGLSKEDIEKI